MPFSGTFDGNNYTIEIAINTNTLNSYAGLFGQTSSANIHDLNVTGTIVAGNFTGGVAGLTLDSTITNVSSNVNITSHEDFFETEISDHGGLIGIAYNTIISESYSDSTVLGNSYLGGLVGKMTFGEITDSYATGDIGDEITGSTNDLGGLVGYANNVDVANSYATGDISGQTDLGGLIGNSESSDITESYATGNVTGSDFNIGFGGGLAGRVNEGTVSTSYATGNVIAYNYAGGLVGNLASSSDANVQVINSYATGNVTATSLEIGDNDGNAGGLIGGTSSFSNSDLVSNSYSTGVVSGAVTGGLIGIREGDFNATILNSFWDTETSGTEISDGGTDKTTAEMTDIETFTTDLGEDSWNFNDIWGINAEINNNYPYLIWQFELDTEVVNAELAGDDNCVEDIELGFDFTYFGQEFSTIDISTNGTVSFNDEEEDEEADCFDEYFNDEAPLDSSGSEDPEQNTLYAFWDDLVMDSKTVLYQRSGDIGEHRMVIQWTIPHHISSDDEDVNLPLGTFQIILDEADNSVNYQYHRLINGELGKGRSATIGLTGPTDDDDDLYEIYSHNTAVLESETGIKFTPEEEDETNYTIDDAADFEDIYLADDRTPEAFQLEGPEDEEVDVSLQPTFSWEDSEEANSYQFFLSSSTNFDTGYQFPIEGYGGGVDSINSKIIYSDLDVEETSLDLSEVIDETILSNDTTYYWFVIANNEDIEDEEEDEDENSYRMSEVFSFETIETDEEASELITSCDDLEAINYNLDGDYTLNENLDCTESGNDIIIASPYSTFTGTFDGNEKTITVDIEVEATEYTGLFSRTHQAEIYDLTIAGSVVGNGWVGGLIGQASETEINNVSITADIDSSDANNGGLVGETYLSTITDSHTTGEFETSGNANGGLVGANLYSEIYNSYSTTSIDAGVEIIADINNVGGLVGRNEGSIIVESYASGDIAGSQDVGGLVGENDSFGSITKSFSLGNVTGTDRVGGLVGNHDLNTDLNEEFVISDSYARGTIESDSDIGGLLGHADQSFTITNSYFTGQLDPHNDNFDPLAYYIEDEEDEENIVTFSGNFWDSDTIGNEYDSEFGTGKTTAEMQDISTFTTDLGDDSWDFDDIWSIDADINDGYPFHLWQNLVEEENQNNNRGGGGNSLRISKVKVNSDLKAKEKDSVENYGTGSESLTYDEEVNRILEEKIILKDPKIAADKCEALTIMARVFKWEIDESITTDNYTDTPSWCKPYANFATARGITQGRDPNALGLDTPVTRNEIAMMIFRELKVRGYEFTGTVQIDFIDELTPWAQDAIEQLAKEGIIKGFADGRFGGEEPILKQDLAVMIRRIQL